MIESVIGLLIALAILGIVYVVLKWILGMTSIPFPTQIINIVFGLVALILVLRYLVTLI